MFALPARRRRAPPPASAAKEESMLASAPRFPADDGGKSLTEMAQRDLEAALQLCDFLKQIGSRRFITLTARYLREVLEAHDRCSSREGEVLFVFLMFFPYRGVGSDDQAVEQQRTQHAKARALRRGGAGAPPGGGNCR